MKKIFCLMLTSVLMLSLFGCTSKSGNIQHSISTEPTTTIHENINFEFAQELILAEDYFFELKNEKFYELMKKVNNEKVIDICEYDQRMCILTDTALYYCSTIGTFQEVIPVDATELECIYDMGDYFIICINSDGKYVVYGRHSMTDVFKEYEFDVYVTNGLDYVTIYKEPNTNYECVYWIKNFEDNEYIASVYEWDLTNDEVKFAKTADGEKFEVCNVDKEMICLYASKENSTKGFALFGNGDLHLATLQFGNYHEARGVYVYEQFIDNIERVLKTRNNMYYFAIKNNDQSNLYLLHVIEDDNQDYRFNETKIPLPSNIDTDDIVEIVSCGLLNERHYLQLIDNSCIELVLNKNFVDGEQTVEEFKNKFGEKAEKLCFEVENGIIVRTYKPEFNSNKFYCDIKNSTYNIASLNFDDDLLLLEDHKLYIVKEVVKFKK